MVRSAFFCLGTMLFIFVADINAAEPVPATSSSIVQASGKSVKSDKVKATKKELKKKTVSKAEKKVLRTLVK